MDPSLLMYRPGVRSLGKKKLADGGEHELFFEARTPEQMTEFLAELDALDKIEEPKKRRALTAKVQSEFLVATMRNQDGTPLLTFAEAMKIPITLKKELCGLIAKGSDDIADAGND